MMKVEIVAGIQKLVAEIKEENNIINEIIRDDVFFILQECNCKVLYYPLEDEDECDGFHMKKPVNNHIEQFVFINTNNTRERQAFSAAHELGHIWNVDERLRKEFPEEEIDSEEVINRFAAELLMPENLFVRVLQDYLARINYVGPRIKEIELVKLIAYLMNYFFVPYKSVVFRFNELKRLDAKHNEKILAYKSSNLIKEIIRNEQYTRLGIVNKLKSLDNLQEYLQEAEKNKLINPTKAKNIRLCFDINNPEEECNDHVEF